MANPFEEVLDPKQKLLEGGFTPRGGAPRQEILAPPPSQNAIERQADPTVRFNPSIRLLQKEQAKRIMELQAMHKEHKGVFDVDAQHVQLWKQVTPEGKKFERTEAQYNKITKQLNDEQARLGSFNKGITSFLGPKPGDTGTAPESEAIDPRTGLPTQDFQRKLEQDDVDEQRELKAKGGIRYGEPSMRYEGGQVPEVQTPDPRTQHKEVLQGGLDQWQTIKDMLQGRPAQPMRMGDVTDFDEGKKKLLEGGYAPRGGGPRGGAGGSVTKFPGSIERQTRQPMSEQEKYDAAAVKQRGAAPQAPVGPQNRAEARRGYAMELANANRIPDFELRKNTVAALQTKWQKIIEGLAE